MRYEEWEAAVPGVIKGDSLWKMTAYRLALFATDVGWHDVTHLMRDRRTLGLADQLYRALGSINANLPALEPQAQVAEGYSRGTSKDRARFYEYALGSARESRDWYYTGRHVLTEAIVQHRLELLTRIIQLLLVAIPQQRQRTLRETGTTHQAAPGIGAEELDYLLQNVSLPDLPLDV